MNAVTAVSRKKILSGKADFFKSQILNETTKSAGLPAVIACYEQMLLSVTIGDSVHNICWG